MLIQQSPLVLSSQRFKLLQSRWTVRTMTALVLTGLLSGVSALSTAVGIEFRETDTLPYVENILFSPSSVGIVSQDGRLFRIDRQTQDVQQLDAQTFAKQFPKPWPPKPSDSPQYGPQILRATVGEEFEQDPRVLLRRSQ